MPTTHASRRCFSPQAVEELVKWQRSPAGTSNRPRGVARSTQESETQSRALPRAIPPTQARPSRSQQQTAIRPEAQRRKANAERGYPSKESSIAESSEDESECYSTLSRRNRRARSRHRSDLRSRSASPARHRNLRPAASLPRESMTSRGRTPAAPAGHHGASPRSAKPADAVHQLAFGTQSSSAATEAARGLQQAAAALMQLNPKNHAKAASQMCSDSDNDVTSPKLASASSPKPQPTVSMSPTGASLHSAQSRENVSHEPNLTPSALTPKPSGHVGLHNRNGYNLLEALHWEDSTFHRIQLLVHDLATIYLDKAKTFAKQDGRKVDLVCQMACQQEPRLLSYEGFWPVKDLLKLYLLKDARRGRSVPRR